MVAVALSPNARALIQSGRNVHRPTTADRRRVGAALRERLGPSVLPTETPVRDLLVSMGWQLPSGTALGLCLFGGALFLALRPAEVVGSAPGQPPTAAFASSAVAVAPVQASPPSERETTSSVATSDPSPKRTAPPVDSSQQSPDSLAQEVALLSRAMSQLHSGQTSEALSILDEHQLRFPRGALSQERSAMRARALCKLQRFREGRVELAGLAPGSIAYERVQKFCDSSPRAGSH